MRFLSVLTLVLITSAPIAQAAPAISDEGAAKVKALVEQMIDTQRTAYTSETTKFITDGDIQVEQAKNYYAVTLPDITVLAQRENDNGKTKQLVAKIGIIGLNVLPTNNPKEWKMAVALPTPIKYINENKQPIMQMDIGNQQMIGTWNEDLNHFSKANAQYEDIIFSNLNPDAKDRNVRIRIDNMSVKTNMQQNDDNTWSGPTKMEISDMAVERKAGPAYLPLTSIGKIQLDASADKFSPDAQRKLEDMVQKFENVEPNEDPSVYLGVYPILLELLDSTALKITMNNLNISPKANAISGEPLKLQQAFLGFGISGLKEKMLGKTIRFGWHGLSGTTAQQDENNAIPTTGSFSFELEKLPLKPLIDMGSQLVDAGVNKDNIAQMAMMNAMMSLPQKLSEAGTAIHIKDTIIKHPQYNFQFDGTIKATQESIIGANGNATIQGSGLQNLIDLLEQQKTKAPKDRRRQLNNFIGQVRTFQDHAQDDPADKDNKKVFIVLDNQGQTLINGRNIKDIMAQQMGVNKNQAQEENETLQ